MSVMNPFSLFLFSFIYRGDFFFFFLTEIYTWPKGEKNNKYYKHVQNSNADIFLCLYMRSMYRKKKYLVLMILGLFIIIIILFFTLSCFSDIAKEKI